MSASPRAAELATALIGRLLKHRYSKGSVMDHGLWPLIHDLFAVARGDLAPSGRSAEDVLSTAERENHPHQWIYKGAT